MNRTSKNSTELEKHKAILLATIDYELKRISQTYKAEELALVEDSFCGIKNAIETNTEKYNLSEIKKTLQQFTSPLMQMGDLAYNHYIKARTGYDVDLFANISLRVQKIIHQNAIKNKRELQDIIAMIALCRQTAAYEYNVAHLKNLVVEYQYSHSKKLQKQASSVFYVAEISSPNFLHYVEVYETHKASTQIQITHCKSGKSVGFFSAEGVNLGLKVYWKNNTHIIIEYSNAIMATTKLKQIETYVGCFLQIEFVLVNC